MTFAKFEELVKEKHPQAEVCKHGEFAGNKINVAVIFNPNGKPYQYNGTYCEVLNRLGIKAIYKHDLISLKLTLEDYIAKHGTKKRFVFFDEDEFYNYSNAIKELTERIADYEANYIIV